MFAKMRLKIHQNFQRKSFFIFAKFFYEDNFVGKPAKDEVKQIFFPFLEPLKKI